MLLDLQKMSKKLSGLVHDDISMNEPDDSEFCLHLFSSLKTCLDENGWIPRPKKSRLSSSNGPEDSFQAEVSPLGLRVNMITRIWRTCWEKPEEGEDVL